MDKEQVQAALDKIRPALQADGGDNGVERVLKEEIPEVTRVEPV